MRLRANPYKRQCVQDEADDGMQIKGRAAAANSPDTAAAEAEAEAEVEVEADLEAEAEADLRVHGAWESRRPHVATDMD